MYVEHVNPRKSSKWVAPPPEEMDKIRKEAGTEVSTPPAGSTHGGVVEGR